MPISATRTTRLLSCHGRANNHGFPFDSRTFTGYRSAIFLSAEFQVGSSRRMSILSRDEHPKRILLEAKLDRAIADQFAIELHRHGLIAFHAQPHGLEIFNLGDANVRTKYDVLQVFDDLKITEPLEDNDVKKTVIKRNTLEEWKRPAIQAAVRHKNK